MPTPQRNQLVWLTPAGWQAVLAASWDAQARMIIGHWAQSGLPLVVTRQRTDLGGEHLSLGLPAPIQWARRRLALNVRREHVLKVGGFPALHHVLAASPGAYPGAPAVDIPAMPMHVYGSLGWQTLTGLNYTHAKSDLDVLVYVDTLVDTLADAVHAAQVLQAWRAPWRVDGEIVFPGGFAVAWRELLQAHRGVVAQVLVKSRSDVVLLTWTELEGLLGAQVLPAPMAIAA